VAQELDSPFLNTELFDSTKDERPVLSALLSESPFQAEFQVPPSTPERYDRDKAVAYARKFWNLPCSDGFVMLDTKNAVQPGWADVVRRLATDRQKSFAKIGEETQFIKDPHAAAEALVRKTDGSVMIPWKLLDDCTHFISCCIGQLDGEETGGLKIRGMWGSPPHDPYGISRVGSLVDYLLARAGERRFTSKKRAVIEGNERTTDNRVIGQLDHGDLIAYWHPNEIYTHLAMYLGGGKIASHTYSRSDLPDCTWDNDWNLGEGAGFRWTFLRITA
jgi:hypothetical protein